jgi:hypothetical protein
MRTRTLQLGAYCHDINKEYRVDREHIQALDSVDFTASPAGS